MNLAPARVQAILAAFPHQRIVVIGDVMLDQLIFGDARRISPEAPIPVIEVVGESHTPGGAANVARNLRALGASVSLLGVTGTDASGELLAQTLEHDGIATSGLIREPGRPTTLKTRVTAQRHQVVRLDRETDRPLAPETADKLLAAYRAALPGAAAVIVTDYAKGVVAQALLDAIVQTATTHGVPVCIDPKPAHRLVLRGAALLTPNRKEAFELAGLHPVHATDDPSSDRALAAAVATILREHAPASLLVTLGDQGLLLVEDGQPLRHLPTFARQVSDVTGAGDTLIAVAVLARAAGATPLEAAVIANHAAGIVVAKLGTAVATVAELSTGLSRSTDPLS